MITLFNRKELRTTFDMKKQAEIRQKLEQNSIEDNIKVLNRKSSSWEKANHMMMN